VVCKIRPDWVFHLAAYGAYSSQTDLRQMIETNITGTVNLVESCLTSDFESFVHTGSSSEYGFKDHAPAETELLEPNTPYAVSKASATLFCRMTAKARDMNLTTLRLYSAFGPYEEPTRLIPTLILRGMEGTWPPLVDPEIARDFVDVEDVAEACCLAASRSGGERGAVYNVGTGAQTSLRRVVEVARRVLPVKDEPRWGTMPPRVWDTRVWVSNPRKIRDELGWEPRTGFEEGFQRFVDWLQDNPVILDNYRKRA
jgi:dolichol-phosphate mannosyltransferase